MGSRYVTQTSVATEKKTAIILRSAIFLCAPRRATADNATAILRGSPEDGEHLRMTFVA
jgi:hypothetical protein